LSPGYPDDPFWRWFKRAERGDESQADRTDGTVLTLATCPLHGYSCYESHPYPITRKKVTIG
jgi:hypothetical protein